MPGADTGLVQRAVTSLLCGLGWQNHPSLLQGGAVKSQELSRGQGGQAQGLPSFLSSHLGAALHPQPLFFPYRNASAGSSSSREKG